MIDHPQCLLMCLEIKCAKLASTEICQRIMYAVSENGFRQAATQCCLALICASQSYLLFLSAKHASSAQHDFHPLLHYTIRSPSVFVLGPKRILVSCSRLLRSPSARGLIAFHWRVKKESR
jgi:hypothetical protein